jgi:mannose-1-phosphate guanylyltransferase
LTNFLDLLSYLREYQALGTAGGIYHFRDEILRGDPKSFFVIHADIACAFPLRGMLDAHSKHRGLCTLLGTKVRMDQRAIAGIRTALFSPTNFDYSGASRAG